MKAVPRGEGWVKIRAVVDSGAGQSVGPRSLADPSKIKPSAGSKAGQCFTSASGDSLPNEGELVLAAVSEDGRSMQATFQVADITRPLLSVSKICEKGHMLCLGNMEASYSM